MCWKNYEIPNDYHMTSLKFQLPTGNSFGFTNNYFCTVVQTLSLQISVIGSTTGQARSSSTVKSLPKQMPSYHVPS